MKVENCVALVTGGNRGIGEGFVQELLAHGASKIYVAARRMTDAEAAAAADDRLVPIELDVTSPEQVAAAAAQCTDLTLLVNNAGAFNLGNTLLTAEDEADIRQTMEVNYLGPVRMIRALSRISASCPASAERRKKGRMNRPEANPLKVASVLSSL